MIYGVEINNHKKKKNKRTKINKLIMKLNSVNKIYNK